MGHVNNFDVFSTKINKSEIYNFLNERNRSLMDIPNDINPIMWYGYCLDSYEDAQKFIEDRDVSYLSIAVKFRDYSNVEYSKELNSLKEKADKAIKAYTELNKRSCFQNYKRDSLTCKYCGSKLSVRHIKNNVCIMCEKDLRPEIIRKKLSALKSKIGALQEIISEKEKEEKKKLKDKAEIFWLVKTEYHV